eukprot:Rmarinus@m.8740
MPDSDEAVLAKLEECFSSPEFTGAISQFVSENSALFTVAEEQTLQNYDLYKKYTHMVEELLENFLSENGISSERLASVCTNAGTCDQTCIDYILASTEYNYFGQMMADFKQMQEWTGAAEKDGLDPVWDCLPDGDDDDDDGLIKE